MTEQTNPSEMVLYATEDGTIKVDTVIKDETLWLTQKKMAELFGVKRPAVTKHLKNIFDSGELDQQVVCSIMEHTTQQGPLIIKLRRSQCSTTISTSWLPVNSNAFLGLWEVLNKPEFNRVTFEAVKIIEAAKPL